MNPLSDNGLSDGDFPFGEIYDKTEVAAIRGKILQRAIEGTIYLDN
jgi:hypothetical protein